jgi:very-short-patch-repair endonuclease
MNYKNSCIDFKCGNKLIEFDGVYWHKDSQEKDIRRNETYEKLGYKLLIINENDLINNKINNELIDKCLRFIKNEN